MINNGNNLDSNTYIGRSRKSMGNPTSDMVWRPCVVNNSYVDVPCVIQDKIVRIVEVEVVEKRKKAL